MLQVRSRLRGDQAWRNVTGGLRASSQEVAQWQGGATA
jgi:hypothetical protein